MNDLARLILKDGRQKSLLRRHPWVFSGAIARVEGEPQTGVTVAVQDAHGEFMALAAYSPASQIRARVWSWSPEELPDADFFRQRIQQSVLLRQPLLAETNAVRLVHAESDGLPGLVVDQFGDVLVVQLLSAGAEFWRQQIVEGLAALPGVETIYERSDAEVRRLEGLVERSGLLWGRQAPEPVQIRENGLEYQVSIEGGQKTGFYLDQRANRLQLRQQAAGRHAMDCFSFTGGFAINALQGGAASVTLVESSEEALALAESNLALNGFTQEKYELVQADVFQQLRKYRDAGRSFDLIVLDPPKFAPTRKQVQQAARGYKDINLLAFKLLNPGGLLYTFSCSGGVDAPLFRQIVAGAALDAGVQAQVVNRLHQDSDHPVALNFPEGEYLKGLVCRIL